MDAAEMHIDAQLVKTLIDNTPIAYIVLDRNYRIHYINESFARLRGLDMGETVGNKCYNISNGGVPCAHCAVAAVFATGEKEFVSRKDILPDGTIRFIDDYAIPLQKDARGETEYVLEIMINRTEEMLAREQRNKDYDEILAVFAGLLDAKDSYTAAHSQNVRRLSINLARAMGLSSDETFETAIAASLHDIGKVDIPLSIISKPGKLTDPEYDVIKKHPDFTHRFLEGLSSFGGIRDIARHHHERIDGRGYPDGLSGDDISIGARIVAVADTYDAMTTTRSYRKALPHEYAVAELNRVAGTQLGKDVVEAFSRLDFDSLENDLYTTFTPNQTKPVERILKEPVKDAENPGVTADLRHGIDLEKLLNAIFENTPCGYVLMDTQRRALFASDYFLEYMGLKKEDVLGRFCYEAGGNGPKPCNNCCIERALKTGSVEHMRHEQYGNRGRLIFDIYGVPLKDADGAIRQVVEIVLDRTEEVQLERARRNDICHVIDTLSALLKRSTPETGEEGVPEKILELRNRLNESLKRKAL